MIRLLRVSIGALFENFLMTTHAKRFRQERNRLGMTQKELAQKINVHAQTIKNYELGSLDNSPITNMIKEGMDIYYIFLGVRTPLPCLNFLLQAVEGGKIDKVNYAIDTIQQNLEFIAEEAKKYQST